MILLLGMSFDSVGFKLSLSLSICSICALRVCVLFERVRGTENATSTDIDKKLT